MASKVLWSLQNSFTAKTISVYYHFAYFNSCSYNILTVCFDPDYLPFNSYSFQSYAQQSDNGIVSFKKTIYVENQAVFKDSIQIQVHF